MEVQMKKFSVVFVIALLLVAATSALAQTGLPGSGWWSGETIQNVGSGDATIQVTAFGGGSSYTSSKIVAPGAFTNFVPGDFATMPSGFQGAALVSSDQPIKAIVNVTNRTSGDLGITGGKAAAQYQGIESAMIGTTIYVPIAKGDSFDKTTTYYIQNAGSSAATATANFTMKNGDTHTYTTPSIEPNEMVVFSIFDSPTYDSSVDNTGKVGAVVISSAEPLAGVVMEHFTTENPATLAQGTRGFTSADFDDKAYAPIVKNNRFGRSTGIQVQNVSGSPIDIKVTFVGFAGACAGTTYEQTATGVASGASAIFNQRVGQSPIPANCTASATIESTTVSGLIVALVSESYEVVPPSGQSAVTSFAIPADSATTLLSAPLFKDDRFDKRTGLQIQNVGSTAASNIVATFQCQGASNFTAVSVPLSADSGGAIQFYTPSDDTAMFEAASPFSSNNVTCSVTVTSDQPIVAIANESPIPGGSLQQDNNNYEGFNLAP
jgi:hypothetical protein